MKLINQAIQTDPYLEPYRQDIARRLDKTHERETQLIQKGISLTDFALGHEYFGVHQDQQSFVFREWAPNAKAIFLIGDFTSWQIKEEFSFVKISGQGVWELKVPAILIKHKDQYRLFMKWDEGQGDRIPAWTRRVVQDPHTNIFNAQIWFPEKSYIWKNKRPVHKDKPLYIYECHIGMATEKHGISTYKDFQEQVLPRIHQAGYNTLQIMALAEHPYYGSFGYQVSSFFACSSKFGTPEDLKELIDTAHGMGIVVLMDLVHSHAVKNEVEGISKYDGTSHQFFHAGNRGDHPAWDSKCFDYGKAEVLHFLLSNCRYWMDTFQVDGFRFDGVTSMLYIHHGLGKNFTGYHDYYNESVDEDAITYLNLANKLIHSLYPEAITIAEDVSGMPLLATPIENGGYGFDYRYAMGVPDYWIKLIKEVPDENWPMGHLWYELGNRRMDEKTISYAESHDQALVGDQTLVFRLIGASMYHSMSKESQDPLVSRGIALHKMIRLITLSSAGHGYLNFMGNEFGHPEWIDFPREGNNWSYHYARRQWSLRDAPNLLYQYLADFDEKMIKVSLEFETPRGGHAYTLMIDEENKVIAYLRNKLIYVFNFHPTRSLEHYKIPSPPGEYNIILDTDDPVYGGYGRLDHHVSHISITDEIHRHFLHLYLPSRCAFVLKAPNIFTHP